MDLEDAWVYSLQLVILAGVLLLPLELNLLNENQEIWVVMVMCVLVLPFLLLVTGYILLRLIKLSLNIISLMLLLVCPLIAIEATLDYGSELNDGLLVGLFLTLLALSFIPPFLWIAIFTPDIFDEEETPSGVTGWIFFPVKVTGVILTAGILGSLIEDSLD